MEMYSLRKKSGDYSRLRALLSFSVRSELVERKRSQSRVYTFNGSNPIKGYKVTNYHIDSYPTALLPYPCIFYVVH